MPRPLLSHPMVFKEPGLWSLIATWTWQVSPIVDPARLLPGTIARNNASLAATTIIYASVLDADGDDHLMHFAGARGGAGAGQADLLIIAGRDYSFRYKITGISTLSAGTIYAFTVSLVAQVGSEPPAGTRSALIISYTATA